MIRCATRFAAATAAGTVSLTALAAPSIHDLGTLTPGSGLSYGLGISDSGDVAVGYSNTATGERAFLWTPAGGMVSLGAPANYTRTRALGISGDGLTVVGFGQVNFSDRALRWSSANGWTTVLSTSSTTYAANTDGSVLTGQGVSQSGQLAFRSAPAPYNLQFLPALPGGGFAIGFGVSGDGRVIVGRSNSTSGDRAFRFTLPETGPGVLTDLGVLPGGTYSYAFGVSDDGNVAVGESFSSVGKRAFRWSAATGMQSLGNLSANNISSATAANGDGSIIVGSASVPGGSRGFVWSAATGMVEAGAYFSARGINMNGWIIDEIRDVNPAATAFVGSATIGGQTRAFVVRGLPSPCLPVITDQPDNTYWTPALTSALLQVKASGVAAPTFRWQFEVVQGVFIDLPEGVYNDPNSFMSFSAVNTRAGTLVISSVENAEPGRVLNFRCIVGGGCVTVPSSQATITLSEPPPSCPADFNRDGFLDFSDFDDFVVSFEAGAAASDFNSDGFLDFSDFDDFVTAFETGC